MAIALVAHAFYYTAVSCLLSRLAPYIPTAKAGGFTALFGKNNVLTPRITQVKPHC